MRSENYANLKEGSFEIEPVGTRQSRITLTTRYERKLTPAWIWEPIERKVIHTLHGHVLEGMRRKAEHEQPQEKPKDEQPYESPEGQRLAPKVAVQMPTETAP
jgi:hypothetical protein